MDNDVLLNQLWEMAVALIKKHQELTNSLWDTQGPRELLARFTEWVYQIGVIQTLMEQIVYLELDPKKTEEDK